ncbi:universal stress protein [Paraburkholderia hospita]|jgi:nucleotide-binding universal stress UspA family protein|uniref:Universal stress protein n=1 Tax=Paraburkholderia hospita TaxID=169430 RepID=A0AAN1JET8_9BURK|nr:universal stress protein [Paraburkholderia hospita]SKC87414.1 Nucleotide-binding universal stress protein, UspA family [Burkholderia sp. CF099]SOE84718.1 Nucleotide-binding universal stress protein, UspA family [Burkholderia sp. YR290]AUT72582.1 universal stress protein [Paraburkholderia hospita]EIM97620.1 UspA domain-containing protein [Paraburkholderia hospita]OUL68627.1 universal stress protein A [Paraburkholderia hospita]
MYERIVVALDDSACAQRALGEAVRLAKESGGVVEVLSVVDRGKWPVEGDSGYGLDPEVRIAASVASHVFEAAQKLLQEAGVRGTVRAIDAYGENVPTVLARAADECDADIIVIGTHGRRGTRRFFLGSVAESLVRSTQKPVLIVRHDSNHLA